MHGGFAYKLFVGGIFVFGEFVYALSGGVLIFRKVCFYISW